MLCAAPVWEVVDFLARLAEHVEVASLQLRARTCSQKVGFL